MSPVHDVSLRIYFRSICVNLGFIMLFLLISFLLHLQFYEIVADCVTGPPGILPNDPLGNIGSYLQLFTGLRYACSGKVVRWRYYSRASNTPVYFGAWRAINSTTFQLVAVNRVVPNRTGLITEVHNN